VLRPEEKKTGGRRKKRQKRKRIRHFPLRLLKKKKNKGGSPPHSTKGGERGGKPAFGRGEKKKKRQCRLQQPPEKRVARDYGAPVPQALEGGRILMLTGKGRGRRDKKSLPLYRKRGGICAIRLKIPRGGEESNC